MIDMKYHENELYKKGYKNIVGLDEAGRGCWAGPLVVAICMFDKNYVNKDINDSKKLTEISRKNLFEVIKRDAIICDWIIYEADFVDRNNPKASSILGMEYLINKYKDKIDYCLIDAEKVDVSVPSLSLIKGDSISQSIAAASIVAKFIKDEEMRKLDLEYPEFNFAKNKGYGTKQHREALNKYGPIKNVHRFSYKPIKMLDNRK